MEDEIEPVKTLILLPTSNSKVVSSDDGSDDDELSDVKPKTRFNARRLIEGN